MMNPHILYWKWNDAVLEEAVMREKSMDIINNSIFDYIYICFHSISQKYRILSSDKGVEVLKKCVALFAEHGRKVIIDTELRSEHQYIEKNFKDRMSEIKMFTGKLDDNGAFTADCDGADSVLRCWAVDFVSEKSFENPVEITRYCKIENGQFMISSDEKKRDIIYYLLKEGTCEDAFSDAYDATRRLVFERLEGIPFGGAATDEMGVGVFSLVEEKVDPLKELTPIECLDINKVNYYFEWLGYSPCMDNTYKKRFGEGLADSMLYFWHTEVGNEAKSIQTVNNYIEIIRKRSVEIEQKLYDLTKEFFGDDAFVGAHPTWWGDELDSNFEAYYNGLDWWEAKRDYAQTDELIIMPTRLAMSRKGTKNIWYNMWYSMRTMDIKSYYKETYTNVIYSGRTHHLGYECYEPGVVLCLNEGTMLNDLSEMEKKVASLDKLQTSRPDSRVLVVFGYESATNHFISDPEAFRVNRRGNALHYVLKTTKALFEHPYLCELVPSTEIDNGYVTVNDGKVSYCGHEYDALVLLCPDGITKSAYAKLKAFDENGGKMIVCGALNIFSDGTSAKDSGFINAVQCGNVEAAEIAAVLTSWEIKQNKGKNYCIYEDGSVTIANPDSLLKVENGVKCEEYGISEEKADIVFIAPDGQKHII